MTKVEYFRYQLLNQNGEFIRELFNIENCNITYSSLSRLKQSAEITMVLETMDELNVNDRIRVIHHIDGVESPVGTFLVSTPTANINGFFKTVNITCYSTLWLLNANKTISRFRVTKGTNVVNEIRRILVGYGVGVDIEPSTKTTSTDREWEIGTPILDVCNDLLKTINYTSLHVDAFGKYIATPYAPPEDRPIDFEYDESDPLNILETVIESELDLFDIPNVFVKYVNNPDTPNLYGSYENSNPQSPTSTVNRPRNVHSEEVQDASDVQTLIDMCKRDASDVSNKYHKITFKTAINSTHGYMNTVYINLNGINARFTETTWSMSCITGGVMTHSAREVIIV